MNSIEFLYIALQEAISSVKKTAEELMNELSSQPPEFQTFEDIFLGESVKNALAQFTMNLDQSKNELTGKIGANLEKLSLINDYLSLCSQRDRLISPTVHLISLLKQVGNESGRLLYDKYIGGDCAASLTAYRNDFEYLCARALKQTVFREMFSLSPKRCRQPIMPSRNEIAKGSHVFFGAYHQSANGDDVSPIEWIVLETIWDHALIITKQGIDAMPYNDSVKSVSWETCKLRTWLNSTFLEDAFLEDEVKAILTSSVDNSSNQGDTRYPYDNGIDTQDKIFVLSFAETARYLVNSDVRSCQPSEYVKQKFKESCEIDSGGWWLRARPDDATCAYLVNADGKYMCRKVNPYSEYIRPSMWINIGSLPVNNP